jgi:hypothetical protein
MQIIVMLKQIILFHLLFDIRKNFTLYDYNSLIT